MKPDVFIYRFEALCSWFMRKPSPDITSIFYDHLEGLSEDEWESAFKWAIATQQFMPTPKMLVESVRGDVGIETWKRLLWASTELNKIRYDSNYLQLRKGILSQIPAQITQFVEDESLILPDIINKTEYDLENIKKRFLKRLNTQINTTKLLPSNNNANNHRLPQA